MIFNRVWSFGAYMSMDNLSHISIAEDNDMQVENNLT